MKRTNFTDLPLTIYTPESGARNPGKIVRGLLRDLSSRHTYELALQLLRRNIKGQYRLSFLGLLWVFLPVAVNTFVWVFLNKTQVLKIGSTDIPYPVYVFAGNLLWQAFAQSLTAPLTAVNRERGMLTKLQFPREALLITGFGTLLFNTCAQFLLFIPLFLWYRMPVSPWLLLAPAGIVLVPLVGFTLGVLVTPVALVFEDIGRVIPVISRFWYFATPIIYPVPKEGIMAVVVKFNPATPIIVGARDLLTGSPPAMMMPFLWLIIATFILLFAGILLYRLSMPHVVERMSA